VDLVPSRRGRRPKRPPTIEVWLAALTAADGRFEADDDEVSALERSRLPGPRPREQRVVALQQPEPARHAGVAVLGRIARALNADLTVRVEVRPDGA
jgi:hypothetical protein